MLLYLVVWDYILKLSLTVGGGGFYNCFICLIGFFSSWPFHFGLKPTVVTQWC